MVSERGVWGGPEGQQHVTWPCSSSHSKRAEATAGRPGMAGHQKGPESLGTPPFLTFTSHRKVAPAHLTAFLTSEFSALVTAVK